MIYWYKDMTPSIADASFAFCTRLYRGAGGWINNEGEPLSPNTTLSTLWPPNRRIGCNSIPYEIIPRFWYQRSEENETTVTMTEMTQT